MVLGITPSTKFVYSLTCRKRQAFYVDISFLFVFN